MTADRSAPISPEHLALRARYTVALLLAELARVRLRDFELQTELAEFVARREGAIAATELAGILECISKGERR